MNLKKRKTPERMCVACREMRDKRSLIRIVKTPEQEVKIDLTGKANGRGAYLCKTEECINLALKKKQLERALNIAIPENVFSELLEKVGHDDRK